MMLLDVAPSSIPRAPPSPHCFVGGGGGAGSGPIPDRPPTTQNAPSSSSSEARAVSPFRRRSRPSTSSVHDHHRTISSRQNHDDFYDQNRSASPFMPAVFVPHNLSDLSVSWKKKDMTTSRRFNENEQPVVQSVRPLRKSGACTAATTPSQQPRHHHSPSSSIVCANCGKAGHVYRTCALPITSFGVICFRWTHDSRTGRRQPQFLMVQRKDSLCFVEFIRGRYDLRNVPYIKHLLRKMTHEEREHIARMTFPELWHSFWQSDQNRGYMREFQQAQHKFNVLRQGYHVSADGEEDDEHVDVDVLLRETESEHVEKEWGFPKGRRNINERDIKCALREFREETGMDTQNVHVHTYIRPFEEVFTACNKVQYRHVYYLVQLKQDADEDLNTAGADVQLQGDKSQAREISRVRWLDGDTVSSKINADNTERKDMFRRVHDLITNSHFLHALKLSWIVRSDVPTIPNSLVTGSVGGDSR